jgi:TrmH family RNA methyltransferase
LLDNVRVVLARTSHPGNIGAAARAMKTMGLTKLYLVDPAIFPNSQADAMASGATDVLEAATVCATLDDALADVSLAFGLSARRRDIVAEVLSPAEAASQLLAVAQTGPVALVFGNEASGLTNEELQRCHALVTIPANPGYSSLNLAAAVQLLSWEVRRALQDKVEWADVPFDAAPLADVERFYGHLETTLAELEFLNPGSPGKLMEKLRCLFSRARLSREEVNILRGVLTAAQEKAGTRKR